VSHSAHPLFIMEQERKPKTENRPATTLIVGVGNDILSDDGIGIKLVWDLEKRQTLDPANGAGDKRWTQEIEFNTAALGGLELVEMIQGYERVIFIDAIMTKDGVPGTVYELKPDNFKWALHIDNMHDMSFLQALEMGKKLKLDIPNQINIIAIEIVEDLLFSDDFSPAVAAKWPEIKTRVEELVTQYLSA